MENSNVRKHRASTARSDRVVPRDVIGSYRGFGFKPRLKAILLSCTVCAFGSALGSVAAFAGTADTANDNGAHSARRAGVAASQAVDECFVWDIACLLERPVGAVPGPGERGQDGDDGGDDDGDDDGGTDDGGTDDGGTDDGGDDDGGTDDGGTDDGVTDDGGPDDGGTDDVGAEDGATVHAGAEDVLVQNGVTAQRSRRNAGALQSCKHDVGGRGRGGGGGGRRVQGRRVGRGGGRRGGRRSGRGRGRWWRQRRGRSRRWRHR